MAPLPLNYDANNDATISRINQSTGLCEPYVAKNTTLFHPVSPVADHGLTLPISLR
jgi:hypothetical protein